MREHTPATTPDIVIHESALRALDELPPEATDQLAAMIRELRENPDAPRARSLFPHPVDHSGDRPDTPVPATRSVSYLRNAVADISPPTVANFDKELAEDTLSSDPVERIEGLREFLYRWIEYIAIQGTRANALYLAQAADDPNLLADRYAELNALVRRQHFPDAADRPSDLSIRVTQNGPRYTAVCPITMFRTTAATPQQAVSALQALLHSVLFGY